MILSIGQEAYEAPADSIIAWGARGIFSGCYDHNHDLHPIFILPEKQWHGDKTTKLAENFRYFVTAQVWKIKNSGKVEEFTEKVWKGMAMLFYAKQIGQTVYMCAFVVEKDW